MKLIVAEAGPGIAAAEYIKDRINKFNPSEKNPFIIALPTGGTSLDMYKTLTSFCRDGALSFKHVVSFNLDEYIGLDISSASSYHNFMKLNFFDHIDMPPQNINIPNGNAKDIAAFCEEYENKIKRLGGIELFIGGLGVNGHIAFNEPGSAFDSRTRAVDLSAETLKSNSRFFGNDINAVPRQAVTMGIGTILDAREIIIMACGANKVRAVGKALKSEPDVMWPVTALQSHKNVLLFADKAAAGEISRYENSLL
ncbi:MAG: glucosamine-6-phosphate deaminase [Elusimicrobiota bacterium]|jgi:glucosamine-6-phosphate deaminase|nr:glucosamine-6-phosphate deaminase [Elusimicrobiota bacterium]